VLDPSILLNSKISRPARKLIQASKSYVHELFHGDKMTEA
jgi:hypothetical protein